MFSPPTIKELSDHQFLLSLPPITEASPPTLFLSFPTLSSAPTSPTPSTKLSSFLSQTLVDEDLSLRWTSWICCVAVYLFVSIVIAVSSLALDWATIQIHPEIKRAIPHTKDTFLIDDFFILFGRLKNKQVTYTNEIIVIFFSFANFFVLFSLFSLESRK